MLRLALQSLENRLAPSATLIQDTNRATDFGSMVELGNALLFVRSTPETGAELWRTDGTLAGTKMVKDIVLGPKGSTPVFHQAAGNYLYFEITTATDGIALWRTDGTAAGTIALRTINSNLNQSNSIQSSVAFNGQFYFGVYQENKPGQFWKSNGTAAGTALLKTIGWTVTDPLNQSGSNGVSRLTVAGNKLFFTAEDRLRGEALWVSNGTASGTRPVSNQRAEVADDINGYGSNQNIHPVRMVGYNGMLYFAGKAFGGGAGTELWRSDGTIDGTELVKDIRTGSNSGSPWQLKVANNKLYFVANDGINGSELWVSDGTSAGTALVRNINPSNASGLVSNSSTANRLTEFNGKLYFLANDGTTGSEWWSTDGTFAGTEPFKDIAVGEAGSAVSNVTVFNNKFYFFANDGLTGREIWHSDGTPSGTDRFVDLEPGSGDPLAQGFATLGSELYWFANTTAEGQALWRTNGTGANLFLQLPGYPTAGVSGGTRGVNYQGSLYYGSESGLWRTTETETVLIVPGYFQAPVVYNDYLYLAGNSTATGTELWRSDGTAAGTALFKDINIGTGSSTPSSLHVHNGQLYFSALQTGLGTELWSSDGTVNGTAIVKDIAAGNASGLAYFNLGFVSLNGKLLFRANDGMSGEELWTTDGTPTGTIIVKDLSPDGHSGATAFSAPRGAYVGNEFFFQGYDNTEGYEIWKTDGTTAGTVRVTDAVGKNVNQWMSSLIELNGQIYFIQGEQKQRTLWALNPNTATVSIIKKIVVPTWLDTFDLSVANGHLYFLGYDVARGLELWTSDGTPQGTQLFYDVAPGKVSAYRAYAYGYDGYPYPQEFRLHSFADGFLFQGYDSKEQPSLWWSDGTSVGTKRVADGYFDTVIGATANGDPLLFFGAPLTGIEPFRFTPIMTTPDSYTLEDARRLEIAPVNGVLANDTDGPQTPAKARLVSAPKNGWLTFNPDGSFSYHPFSRDFSGTDTFTYKASGDVEESAPTTVTINVDATNQKPTPQNDAVTGRLNRTLTVNVLANDSDTDDDSLSIVSFTQGANGKVIKVGTNLRYIPNTRTLTDTFTYTVRDPRATGEAEYASATVTVTLVPVAVPKVTSMKVYPGTGTGYVDLLRTRRKTLPFQQLSRLEMTFSGAVSVHEDDLQLYGLVGGHYSLTDFNYNATTRTASWTVTSPLGLGPDRLTFMLDGSNEGVFDSTANPLGDWTRSIMLLAGDYNGDGQVASNDATTIARRLGLSVLGSRFYADIDGNGLIDANDVALTNANLGHRIW